MDTLTLLGLESDFEDMKSCLRSSSPAHATAVKALLRLRSRESHDLLSPLLLVLSHKDVPSLGICAGFAGVQRLARARALRPSEEENVCAVLEGNLSRHESAIDFKVLQTCSVMIQCGSEQWEVARKLTRVVCDVADEKRSKDPGVRNAAVACLIQIATAVFERATAEAASEEAVGVAKAFFEELCAVPERNDSQSSAARAVGLMKIPFFSGGAVGGGAPVPVSSPVPSAKSRAGSRTDLVINLSSLSSSSSAAAAATISPPSPMIISSSSPPPLSSTSSIWIEPNKICNKDALEILDTILSDYVETFVKKRKELGSLIKDKCGPVVVNLLRGKYRESSISGGYGWLLLVRLMRTTKCLLASNLRELAGRDVVGTIIDELVMNIVYDESNVLVTPPWHHVLNLETFLAAFHSPGFIHFFFESTLPQAIRAVDALCKLIASWSQKDWSEVDHVARDAELLTRTGLPPGGGGSGGGGGNSGPGPLSVQTSRNRNKVRGLELLGDLEPPSSFSGAMVVLIATECLVAIVADGGGSKDLPPTVRVGGLLRRKGSASGGTQTSGINPELAVDDEVSVSIRKQVLESTWKSCLSALSCLLRGCQEEGMIQYVLRAYLSLTTACGALNLIEGRDAFISSLCRFALPLNFASSFSNLTLVTNQQHDVMSSLDPNPVVDSEFSQSYRILGHKHLQVLKTLFNIAHGLGSLLGTSWNILLETFERLDHVLYIQTVQMQRVLHRQGSGVGGSSSDAALNEMANASSIADDADEEEIQAETRVIESMLKNLFETSKYLDDEALQHVVIALSQMIFTSLAHASTTGTGGTPVKAAQPLSQSFAAAVGGTGNPQQGARKLFENLANSLKTALTQPSNNQNVPQQYSKNEGDTRFPPFALEKIVETAELNSERASVIFEVVGSTLLTVASSEHDVRVRAFAVKSLEKIVSSIVNGSQDVSLKRDVVRKFTELIRSPQNDTKEFALQALYRFMSAMGHKLEGMWTLVVAELLIVATTLQGNKPVSTLAFKVVQLVMDDYRPSLDVGCLPSLALCLRAFGEQQNDMNVSLTAVHHLWLLCEKGDDSLEFKDGVGSTATQESLLKANALWLHLFYQLRALSLDPRMEVRNSALRSLCTNIVATGDKLTVDSWRTCATEIMLPLIYVVDERACKADSHKSVLGEKLSSHSDARMTLHHSQDTEEKQWRETRVTVVQGTSKVVIYIVSRLEGYRELAWFIGLWDSLLQVCERILSHSTPARDVVLAGVTVLEELSILVCGAKSKTKYAVPGMRVVNGTLVRSPVTNTAVGTTGSTGEATPGDSDVVLVVATAHTWLWPSILSVYSRIAQINPPPFDVDIGTSLVNVFAELYDSKSTQCVRSSETLKVVLTCMTTWVLAFRKQKSTSKFISSLERNVLKTYGRLPPLQDDDAWIDVVFEELLNGFFPSRSESPMQASTLSGSGNAATAAAVTTTNTSGSSPSLQTVVIANEEEFRAKIQSVFLDLYAVAPDSAKAHSLHDALLKNNEMIPKILALGLAALPGSGMLSDTAEDVWMRVLERCDFDDQVFDVLMLEGLGLVRAGKVPTLIRGLLIRKLRDRTISASAPFATKTRTIEAFFNALRGSSKKDEVDLELLPSALECCDEALDHYQEPGFIDFLERFVAFDVDPGLAREIASSGGGRTVYIDAASKTAACRGTFKKSHFVLYLDKLGKVASQCVDTQIRVVAAKALVDAARFAWNDDEGKV